MSMTNRGYGHVVLLASRCRRVHRNGMRWESSRHDYNTEMESIYHGHDARREWLKQQAISARLQCDLGIETRGHQEFSPYE